MERSAKSFASLAPFWAPFLALWAITLLLVGGACNPQVPNAWDTHHEQQYCGKLVALADVFTSPQQDGFHQDLELALTFQSDGLNDSLGTLSSNDPEGPCAPSPTFDSAPLRSIPELQHDPLSTFQFGFGRNDNFVAWATSTCRGSMLVVLSLMADESIELRLLKDISPEPTGPDPRAGFALFRLTLQEQGCEFSASNTHNP